MAVPASATAGGIAGAALTETLTAGEVFTSLGLSAAEGVAALDTLCVGLLGIGLPEVVLIAGITIALAGMTYEIATKLAQANLGNGTYQMTEDVVGYLSGIAYQHFDFENSIYTFNDLPVWDLRDGTMPYLSVDVGAAYQQGSSWYHDVVITNTYTGASKSTRFIVTSGGGSSAITSVVVGEYTDYPTQTAYNGYIRFNLSFYNEAGTKIGNVSNPYSVTTDGVTTYLFTYPPLTDTFPVSQIIRANGTTIYTNPDSITVTGEADAPFIPPEGYEEVWDGTGVTVEAGAVSGTYDITIADSVTSEGIRNENNGGDDQRGLGALLAALLAFLQGRIIAQLLSQYLPAPIATVLSLALYAVLLLWIIRLILNR